MAVRLWPALPHLTVAITYIVSVTSIPSPPSFVKQPMGPKQPGQPRADELPFKVVPNEEKASPFIIGCEAKGEPPPSYTWLKDGKPFKLDIYGGRITQEPGSGSLLVTLPKEEDEGIYQCKATNKFGTALSNSVFVRRISVGSFKDQPPVSISANEGAPLKLDCTPPGGYPKPALYWMIQGVVAGSLRSVSSPRMTPDPTGNLWFSNVTVEDESDNFVYACSARYGNEYKVGNRMQLKVIRTGRPPARNRVAPVEQYTSNSTVYGLRDQRLELWCIYGGTPLPIIDWQRSDGELDFTSGRVRTAHFGKTLVIDPAKLTDEGEYYCTARNGVGSTQTKSFTVKMEAAPYFTREPTVKTAAEEETVVFECEAGGVPPAEIRWIHNGRPIEQAPPNPRRTVTKNRVTIVSLTKNDTGNYGCNATNRLGYVYKDVYVNVLALPAEIQRRPQDVAAVAGSRVALHCGVFGAPAPKLTWLRQPEGQPADQLDRHTVQPNGTLIISDVEFGDSGTYTCEASNKLGVDSANGSLVVKKRTRIVQGPDNYRVVAGEPAKFRCTASADRTLDVTVSWLADGYPIDFGSDPKYILGSDNSLTIPRTEETDSMTYTCVASTDLDSASASGTLEVEDVPNAPTLIRASCRRRQAEIEWAENGDNRAPITSYTIQYNTSFTPDEWVDASQAPSSSNSYVISLSPWANYTFRVVAKNRVGPSPPSQHSDVCTTPMDVPDKNPEKVVGRGSRPDNLVIKWKPMPEIEHNAPGFHYVVQWRREKPQGEWQEERVDDWRQGELMVPNQPTYRPYKVRVEARNQEGPSSVTPVDVDGWSGEDVPTAAPKGFNVTEILNGKHALFSWEPVDNRTLRGEFKGYKIQTWTDEGGPDRKEEMAFAPDTTSGLYEKLKPHTTNYAQVMAYNGAYLGPPSPVVSFKTPQEPPSAITSLGATPLGARGFYLMWTKPLETNGELTGYRIRYQKLNGLRVGPLQGPKNISDPGTTRAKLGELRPDTKYRISVRATNAKGEGQDFYVEETTGRDQPAEPDKPDLLWVLQPPEEGAPGTSLKVIWLPNIAGRPGEHFYVQYRRHGETAWSATKPERQHDSVVLYGLEPDTVYEIRTVSVEGNYAVHSDTEEVWISTSDGPYIQPARSLTGSPWFIAVMLALALLLLLLALFCILRRNRGGKYDVQDRELAHGRGDLLPEEGFQEYHQPLDSKLPPGSRGSLASDLKQPLESDTDSMAEYGDDGTVGMNEDGSFIGQYGRRPRSFQRADSSTAALI